MDKKCSDTHIKKNIFTSKTNIICFIMFVLLTFIDQFSKQIASHFLRSNDFDLIPGVLQLHYLENTGAAWGMMQNRTWLLLAITVVVLGIILYALYRFCLLYTSPSPRDP